MTENDGIFFLIFKHVLLFILNVFLAHFKVVKIVGICQNMSEMTENVIWGCGGGGGTFGVLYTNLSVNRNLKTMKISRVIVWPDPPRPLGGG